MNDFKFAVRQLLKNPGFTAVAVLTLALGIGANTAIFSMADSALWHPLPFRESDRLVEIWENDPAHPHNLGTSGYEYLDWKANCHAFSEVAALWYQGLNLGDLAEPERVSGAKVTENFFRTLDVHPALGRFFTQKETETGQNHLAVLGHRFWKRRFGGSSNAIGQTLKLNGELHEIIGVAPANAQAFAADTSVWLPLAFTKNALESRGYRTIGRLKSDVSPAQARVEMGAVAARMGADSPTIHSHLEIDLRQLNERFGGSLKLFQALLVIVGIVLIIACANLAGLLSVRSVHRQCEIGVRGALGASRLQIVRQLIVESLVLSCAGGLAGVLFARWGFDLMLRMVPSTLATTLGGVGEFSLNWKVAGYALGLSLGCGILFGLVPAIQTSRHSLGVALQTNRSAGVGHQSKRLSHIFVGIQVAICFAYVSVTGTIFLSVIQFLEANPGFDSNNLLTFRLTLTGADFATDRQRIVFLERLNERLRALPGVQSASSADILPFAGMRTGQINVAGEASKGGRDPRPLIASVSPDYFQTMREPLIRGRCFTPQDDARSLPVAMINENLAHDLFGKKQDPLGRRILLRGNERPFEIIGIVRNVHQYMLLPGRPLTAKLYLSQFQNCPSDTTIAIRTEADTSSVMAATRKAVSELKHDLAVFNVKTMDRHIAEDQEMTRYGAACLAAFALVALGLAVMGIHGTVGHLIAQRTREFGVRIALGSSISRLLFLVTFQGMKPVGVGLLLGFVGSLALHAILQSSIVGVALPHLRVFVGIAVAMITSMLMACTLAALRVRRTNPVDALRHE